LVVVGDAGPLIALARIDRLELLRALYGSIWVPEPVWEEVVINGEGLPGATAVAEVDWILRREATVDAPLTLSLRGLLDRGEAAAIALATSVKADLLLIDERRGRVIAKRLGLPIKGTLGVLLAAQRGGHLDAIAPSVEALRSAGLYLSDALVKSVLEVAGEG